MSRRLSRAAAGERSRFTLPPSLILFSDSLRKKTERVESIQSKFISPQLRSILARILRQSRAGEEIVQHLEDLPAPKYVHNEDGHKSDDEGIVRRQCHDLLVYLGQEWQTEAV